MTQFLKSIIFFPFLFCQEKKLLCGFETRVFQDESQCWTARTGPSSSQGFHPLHLIQAKTHTEADSWGFIEREREREQPSSTAVVICVGSCDS